MLELAAEVHSAFCILHSATNRVRAYTYIRDIHTWHTYTTYIHYIHTRHTYIAYIHDIHA